MIAWYHLLHDEFPNHSHISHNHQILSSLIVQYNRQVHSKNDRLQVPNDNLLPVAVLNIVPLPL